MSVWGQSGSTATEWGSEGTPINWVSEEKEKRAGWKEGEKGLWLDFSLLCAAISQVKPIWQVFYGWFVVQAI